MPDLAVPLSSFLTVWAFLAMNIATPGPNVLNTIALAIGSGRRAGIGSALGVGLGIGLWCLGMSLGLSVAFQHAPWLRTAMTLLACGLLIWFASRYLSAAGQGWRARGTAMPMQGRAGVGMQGAFLRSLSVNASNPKALTTWVAVLAMFPVARAEAADLALLCIGACTLSFLIHSVYAFAFSTPVAARAYLRAAPVINAGVAVFFLVFAARLAWSQLG
ncbi:MAG: LysE family translocator [Gemmobacter sp.]|uniref:LysE family translocator n=1 Tax=Gemmobacter sp. TaxID=1898957 RepID=UPI00391C8C1D